MDTDFMIPIVFFGVIAYIIKIAVENRTRRILIEKGEINENLKYLYADKFIYAVPSSLKWGMVLIALGLAFLFSEIFDFGMDEETALFSLMFLFGGAALIIYYFIGSNMLKKEEREANN